MLCRIALLDYFCAGVALLLAGCASNPSAAERASIHKIRVVDSGQPVKSTMYSDTTSQAAMQGTASFGLVGALIGGGIAAADIHSGITRWTDITQGHSTVVLQGLHESLREYFAKQVAVLVSQNAEDATLDVSNINYGVAHAGDQQFKAVVFATLELTRPDGKRIWFFQAGGASMSVLSHEQYAAHPGAFTTALNEAVNNLAENAVLAYQGNLPAADTAVRPY